MSMPEIYESKLANTCALFACGLSYNDHDKDRPSLKHVLQDASHCLDWHAVKVHKKKDGLLIINARGKSRFMTKRERFARWLLKGKLEIRP